MRLGAQRWDVLIAFAVVIWLVAEAAIAQFLFVIPRSESDWESAVCLE
jgi:hypothetical protein